MKALLKKALASGRRNIYKRLCALVGAASIFTAPAYAAGGFANSTLAIGLLNLINDVSLWLVVLCPLVGGTVAVGCFIMRSMADEQDGKLWTKRIKMAIVCGVSGMLVNGVITLISSYFTA